MPQKKSTPSKNTNTKATIPKKSTAKSVTAAVGKSANANPAAASTTAKKIAKTTATQAKLAKKLSKTETAAIKAQKKNRIDASPTTKKPVKTPVKTPAQKPSVKPVLSSTKSIASKSAPTNKSSASKSATASKSKAAKTTVSTAENPAASKLAKKLTLPFNIGDYVFYPNEGVGYIIGTEDIMLENVLTPYYVIRFAAQKMTNRIPIANCRQVKLRKIMGKTVANNVLKVFDKEPEKTDLSWKDRLLVYQKINSKGNSIEMAEMLTALFFRKQEKSNLSFQERQVFDFTLEALSNEIAIVLGKTTQEIIQRLSTTYNNSIALKENEE